MKFIMNTYSHLQISPESVADLVDLEQELSSLQRGINQMERITPNDGTVSKSSLGGGSVGNDDPFGDSFTNFPVAVISLIQVTFLNGLFIFS